MSAWSDGAILRGRYRILGKIGEGGMGTVYKALHIHFQELRALKVLRHDLANDPAFVQRFRQEAVITRKLEHPNAVRVEDIDESEDGSPFIVMELIEGIRLQDVIAAEAPLAAARCCRIVSQVASALAAAHNLGIVHRDIKPANIVLLGAGDGEQAKVLDFGIAKLKEAFLDNPRSQTTLTVQGMIVGTPAYMSPEQAMGCRGRDLDGRSDVYSLGVVAFQMLTGDLPFQADSDMGYALAHLQSEPRSLLAGRPDIPPAVANVIMSCLEKSTDRRPSAEQLLEGLARAEAAATGTSSPRQISRTIVQPRQERGFVEVTKRIEADARGQGDRTPPPPVVQVDREVKRRNASGYLVAAATAVAVVVAIAGWYLFSWRARSAPRQLESARQAVVQPAQPTTNTPVPAQPATETAVPTQPTTETSVAAQPTTNISAPAQQNKNANSAAIAGKPRNQGASAASRRVKKTPPNPLTTAGSIVPLPKNAPPAPAPPVAAPTRVRVSGGVQMGRLIREVKPVYPPIARQARIQGMVVLEAQISKDGKIESLQLVSGHPILAAAAIDAVKQWRYSPYLLNGEPVAVDTQIRLNFTLAGN